MSPELVKHIRTVANDSAHQYGAYRVRYLKTNADASKIHRTFNEYYQLRLVRTDIGAHFERPVHERIVVPPAVLVGQTEAPWYVPLDADDLSLLRNCSRRKHGNERGWRQAKHGKCTISKMVHEYRWRTFAAHREIVFQNSCRQDTVRRGRHSGTLRVIAHPVHMLFVSTVLPAPVVIIYICVASTA